MSAERPVWLPPPEECEEDQYPYEIAPDHRVIVRLLTHRTRIVEFAIIHQVWNPPSGDWQTVAKADTCHEEVHIHRYRRGGGEFRRLVVQPIQSIEDVDRGFESATHRLIADWEKHLRRWRHGL